MVILTRELPDNRFLEATANPMLSTTGGQAFSAMFGGETLGSLVGRQFRLSVASKEIVEEVGPGGVLETKAVDRTDTVPADKLNEQYPGVGFDRAMTPEAAQIIADAKKAEMIRNDIVSRYDGWAAPLAGSFAAMATDPLEVASAFVPVVGPIGRAALVGRLGRVGGRIAEGVIEGAVGNALTEPLYYGLSRSQRLDYDMSDALMNIGLGGALGGVIGTGAAALGRVGRAAGKAAPEPAPRVSLDPRVDMTPPQKQAALNTAVAQVAQGRAVDVPLPKRATTTLEALRAVGVRDDAGDLAAMGVRDWDRQARFARNVVRDDGIGRDEAARWLWDHGYLRDQPEAQQMRMAERGEAPEPDLVAAMDRVIDDELRGSPRYAEGKEPVRSELREQVARRSEMREALGPQSAGLRDSVIDDVIERVDQGQEPREALRGAMGFDPRPDDVEDTGWAQAALDRQADEEAGLDPEEDGLLAARIDDFRNRGMLTEADLAAIEEMDFVITSKVGAVRDVARAAATCAIGVPF